MRQALRAKGGEIVALFAGSPAELKEGRARDPNLPCICACDPNAEAAAQLNLLQSNMAKVGKRLAIPANILVDAKGIVRWARYANIVMDRPHRREVLRAVMRLPESK